MSDHEYLLEKHWEMLTASGSLTDEEVVEAMEEYEIELSERGV